MKKIDVGQAINTLANVGVILGIVFLALELRQNNAELASQTRTSIYEMRSSFERDFISNNGGIVEIVDKLNSGQQLTGVERRRIGARRGHAINTFQFMFQEDRQAAEEAADWMMTVVRGDPGFVEFWERDRGSYDPEFAGFIEQFVIGRLDP